MLRLRLLAAFRLLVCFQPEMSAEKYMLNMNTVVQVSPHGTLDRRSISPGSRGTGTQAEQPW